MKKVFALFFILCILPHANAQQGSPLLTNYTESRKIENQCWAICQDKDQMMFFANRKGVFAFDGMEWTTIKIPTIPYTIQKNPYDGRIYIGGENKYGYITKDGTGIYSFVSLCGDSAATGIITKIIFDGQFAWFYSEQLINRFNFQSNKPDVILESEQGYPFTGMFVTPEHTFINVYNKGLYRLESDTLFPIVTGYLTEKIEILFSLPYDSNLVLLGFGNSTLHLFDGIKYYDYQIKDEGYLYDNILSEGITLGDTAYAFSTLDGGAIVIEKSSRKLLFTINNRNELPDDEIFALGSDNTGGLWLSHQYGLTRADLKLPVSNYSIFPGLNGNLSSVLKYNNELYVATSEGVFFLSEVRKYDEKEILVKTRQVLTPDDKNTASVVNQDELNNRKNIFSRIFGRRTEPEKIIKAQKPPPVNTKIIYSRKKVSRLKSISYQYIKVEGLSEKCRQLVSTPNGILAATNKGLYIINEHKAHIITPDRYINHISWVQYGGRYYVAASDGYFTVMKKNGEWITEMPDPEFYKPVYSVSPGKDNILWLGSDNVVFRAKPAADNGRIVYNTYLIKNDFPERYTLDIINDSVFLYSEKGIYFYNIEAGKFDPYPPYRYSSTEGMKFYFPLSNRRLIMINDKWIERGSSADINETELSLLKIFDDIVSVTAENDYLWVIDGNNRLYTIERKKPVNIDPLTNVFIKSITNRKGILFNIEDVKFDRGNNIIGFSIVAPGYLKQNTTRYQYFINKMMTDWSQWSARTNYVESVIKPGDYILQVRAMDIWGNIGEPKSVRFTITAPFTRTIFFYLLTGFLVLMLGIVIIHLKENQLYKKNRLLEEKVKERTSEIEAQKKEITSSIEYASRIQKAILPVEDHFREMFSDYFIFYKPRDIVSGDFYWIGENDRSIFFTVADCTGHGVPGAFMSTMGVSTLHEIIANNRNLQANKVLNLLRKKIVEALHQTGAAGEMSDGMDIALCVLSKDRRTLQFSGAFNPLVIVRRGEFIEYKGDKMPIGIHHGIEASFTNYVIDVNKGDTIFLFSDGFASQFGGAGGTKYKKSNFKNLLSEIYYKPMVEQRNILEMELDSWKGSLRQVDDITILGVRI